MLWSCPGCFDVRYANRTNQPPTDSQPPPTNSQPTSTNQLLTARSRAVDLVRSILDKGHLQDIAYMVKKLRQLLGDCTFLEAYERTGGWLAVGWLAESESV